MSYITSRVSASLYYTVNSYEHFVPEIPAYFIKELKLKPGRSGRQVQLGVCWLASN